MTDCLSSSREKTISFFGLNFFKTISTNKLPGKMKRPLNSKLDISMLEKFLNFKSPNWELIFFKKINRIIKNYDN